MKRTAFLRCWNEEATIIACLMSIENVFTNIVIIHSDINDSSLELIEAYSRGRNNIIVERYPHSVYPALHDAYETKTYSNENSLASYYNFGLKICQKVGGAFCKIDGDQIYLERVLSDQFEKIRNQVQIRQQETFKAWLWGINSFVHNNIIMVADDEPMNGLGDHYIYSNSNCIEYYQTPFYEIPGNKVSIENLGAGHLPCWFHFRRRIQRMTITNDKPQKKEYALEDYITQYPTVLFDDDLIDLFEKNIKPFLEMSGSAYRNLRYC